MSPNSRNVFVCPKKLLSPLMSRVSRDLTYEERPIRVLEEMERVTRNKVIKFYKVIWNNHSEQDAMWEREDYLREVYPSFYEEWWSCNLRMRFLLGGRAVTP